MTVPGWAAALVRFLAPDGRAEDALGDLNEMHARRRDRLGWWPAHLVMVLSVLDMTQALARQRFVGRFGGHRNRGDPFAGGTPLRFTRRRWDVMGMIEGWARDFGLAARSLRKAKGFTAITVGTLALAIGANTAIFSVVDAVLLDPLDYPAAERLVVIRASAPGTDMPPEFSVGPEFFVQYREEADMLEDLGMYRTAQTTVRTDERTERLFIAQATPSLYTTLGARPTLGRLPTVEDARGSVGVISHRLWEEWFGMDPEVIGRSLEVSGRVITIAGVLDPGFRFPSDRTSVWVHAMLGDPENLRPGNLGFGLIGRMRSGVGPDDLATQLAPLAARIPERFGDGPPRYQQIMENHRPVVRSLEEELVGEVQRPLWLLLGTVGLVLLIACANVANLFLVRAESRRTDLAVRQALGAGRGGLIRGQMAEAFLLAGAGGAVGALLAWAGIPLLVRAAPESIPNLDLTRLNGTALLFTAALALVTAAAFGLLPALRSSQPRMVGGLRQAGVVGLGGSRLTRSGLVFLQTATALVLLVGSGLLMRSFYTLTQVDPGYDTADVFSFQVAPSRDELNDGPSFARFHTEFMERVAALPGVESVALTNWLPLDEGAGDTRFYTREMLQSGEQPPIVNFTFVGGDYFGTMGISVLRGRGLDDRDQRGVPAAVVGESTARLLWPGEEALGQMIAITPDSATFVPVVGVVEDILLESFRQAEPDPMVYLPMQGPTGSALGREWAVGSPAYVVKTPRADVIAADIRALMLEVVPESPMYRIFTMEGLERRSMAQLSFTMMMLAISSILALILGAVGLYGVLSYVVSHRRREIAVRMTLGAEARTVRQMVVLQGARVAVGGVAVGVLAAAALARVLDSLLYGVETLDPPTFVVMSALMLSVAVLASYIPARRASAVDPMASLRSE